MSSAGGSLRPRKSWDTAWADCAANFVYQTQINFLLFFYTNVLGISPGAAGSLLLVSRVVDAVDDPIVGAIADRTSSRWGRYRPWILISAVPLAVALVLTFTTPSFTASGKLIWAYATYNLLMLMYAANNIPYCALSGVMTADPLERTSLASWRFVCAMGAALVVNTFTMDLVGYFGRGDAARGFQLTMAMWGAIAVVLLVITFVATRKRVPPPRHPRTTVRQDLRLLLGNGPWLALFVASVLISIQLAVRGSTMLYYFNYYLHREDLFGWFNGVGLAVVIVGVAFSKPLATTFGKRDTVRFCLMLAGILTAMFALVPPNALKLLFVLQVLLQLAIGPTIPIVWAMMADVADYSEWKHGHQSTALAFASIVFGGKLGSGIGGWLSGALFDYFGYTAGTELSESAVRGIVWMVSVIPAGALLLGLFALMFYGIDRPTERMIESALRERRDSFTLPPRAEPEAL